MQVKITMKCHFTPTRKAIIKKMVHAAENIGKLEASHTVAGTVKWFSSFGSLAVLVKQLQDCQCENGQTCRQFL